MRFLLLLTTAALLLTACHKHDDEEPIPARTVLVYMAADNDLSGFAMYDINEMMTGSKDLTKRDRLVIFVDKPNQLPYMMEVNNGDTIRKKTWEKELKSSNAETLRMALQWTVENYPADSYGLVLWGHADGWTIHNEATSRPERAYGADTTNGTHFMNIPTMAKALGTLPHLLFIFADCCSFQCAESAYELRKVTDYIIASPAEIPGEGAPYHRVVPKLFSRSERFYEGIVDAYAIRHDVPLSVVKTSMTDSLAQATRSVLEKSITPGDYPDVDSLIYYFSHTSFDMNDFMLRHVPTEEYEAWKDVFDKTVVYKAWARLWTARFVPYTDNNYTDFLDFKVTEERQGCVSMFVYQNPWNVDIVFRSTVSSQNQTISSMEWYEAAGLKNLGW